MRGKEFIHALANGKSDIIQIFLGVLSETGSRYCLIGGLAVNAYVEPVVSLDLDIVAAVADIGAICKVSKERGLMVEEFEHRVNISSGSSDLRIQIQTDPLYQSFISNAKDRNVLGYKIKVASLQDVLQGKIWAHMDKTRRKSKRQKDLADISRLIEEYPQLEASLPQSLREAINK
jgi:hypothetical protein